MTRIGILAWDWRGQPDLDTLRRILAELGGLTLTRIDTGSDEYAIAIAETSLDDNAAQQAWAEHQETGAAIIRRNNP